MSKISNVFRMLILLKNNQRIKKAELAELLEVQPKMIQNYKSELEKAGIFIDSYTGSAGGYSLSRAYDYLIHTEITADEWSSFEMGLSQLSASGFVYEKELHEIYSKLKAESKMKNLCSEVGDVYGSKALAISTELQRERTYCKQIHHAILSRKKLEIQYHALSSDVIQTRIIQAYALYEYRGSLYITAYCELRSEIRDFKLTRIKALEKVDSSYQIPIDFSLQGYMKNCMGIFKDPEIKVKLTILYPMSEIISEKIWTENQKIIKSPDGQSITFEASLRGRIEIISWILSMGSSCIVISPEDLKEDVEKEAKKILENYSMGRI